MLALKLFLTIAGMLLMAVAIGMPLQGLWMLIQYARRKSAGDETPVEPGSPRTGLCPWGGEPKPIAWRAPVAMGLVGCLPLLVAASIVVVPSGMGGVVISQLDGTLSGTLYPGVHFITPLIDRVEIFDLRDRLFTTGVAQDSPKTTGQKNGLDVQSREGLNIGLGVTVRYRLDPNKLASVEAHLPQPADKELVPPVVGSAWRELAPQYTVREIFSTKREEVRSKAATVITRKLGSDGIVVEEVMLSEIQLPTEYAKGLEGLLLKEQEDDQLGVMTDIQQKQVKIAELQAEAEKVQKVKLAEARANPRVGGSQGARQTRSQYTMLLEAEADRAKQARSASSQGSDHPGCGGRR